MPDSLRNALSGSQALWSGLGLVPRLLLVGLALLLPVAIVVGSHGISQDQYVPLFASLSPEEAGGIIAQLKTSKTPYRLAGDQVLVPADQVGEVRLRMATQGMPLGGGVGFEVFDRTTLGVSDFTQRLNYQRALQGELARTIGQLRGVQRARVHLVIPQPSLFTERERPASASVFLKLASGARLGREEVQGIVHLVASSVEGLTPERITVVDTAGRVLLAGGDTAGPGQLSPRRLEMKGALEDSVERRVQSLLDAALGPGQAVTRVSAQINFDQVERTEERYDPNSVVKQESRTTETSKNGTSTPVASAAQGASPQSGTSTADASRESETVSYEVSKLVARTLVTPGEIQRLSVAVLLNVPTKVDPGGPTPAPRTAAPRSADEIEKIRRIVMGAVGFNQTRGDEVTVVEIPFDTTLADRERGLLDAPAPPAVPPGLAAWMSAPAMVAAAVVLALAVLAAVWLLGRGSRRRALAAVTRSLETSGQPAVASRTAREMPAAAAAYELEAGADEPEQVPEEFLKLRQERKGLRQRAVSLASAEPEATAQLLRVWMTKRRNRPSMAGGIDGS